MSGRLILGQRLSERVVDLRLLRQIVRMLLDEFLRKEVTELGIHIIDAPTMAQLNETFLQHKGPTDVITFDYTEGSGPGILAGEIFVCFDEAQRQARSFRVDWQTELVRYVVHGILHLCGHDDQKSAARARMKREENRLLKALNRRFNFKDLRCGRHAR